MEKTSGFSSDNILVAGVFSVPFDLINDLFRRLKYCHKECFTNNMKYKIQLTAKYLPLL